MSSLSRFDLNLLTVFEAIYSRQGVSGAARRLNLSQPAISHSLARLREAFDDPLFVREGNGMVPTTRARALIQPIREALGSVEAALGATAAFDPSSSTRDFSIGLRPSSEMPGFGALVGRAIAEAPGITLSSRYFSRRKLGQALASGDLDLALDISATPLAGILSTPLGANTLVVAVRDGHPSVGASISLDDYKALDHVFVSPRPTGLGLEDAALGKLGHRRRIKVRCQHAFAAWEIVASSDMICTLPQSYARALIGLGGNRLLELPLAVKLNEVSLHWHEAADADPGTTWLRTLVERHLAKSLA